MPELLLDTGLWALVAASAFALMVALSAIGAILEPRTGPASRKSAGRAMILLMLGLCIVLAMSFVPIMVGTVLGFQEVIGNRGIAPIGFALDNQAGIVVALWLILIAGSLIAIPAMLRDMEASGP